MKIKTSGGTILESSNPLVTEQWKKQGHKDEAATVNADKSVTTGKRRKKE
ncbi:MAG: hypothetical protein J6B43_11170 [Lachnospiraceae bacterium]|nr:hypothetical protein [Lachnospiraceae bacterium]